MSATEPASDPRPAPPPVNLSVTADGPPAPPSTGGPEQDRGPRLGALPGDEPADRHRLPARTLAYWRVRALVIGLAVTGLLVWWAAAVDWFVPTVRWSVVGAAVAWFLLVGVLVRPIVRWKLFWYAVTEEEIDLQHGWLTRTRTVVPMNRVQHLKSEQGLLARPFRLSVLHIHTAAGAVVVDGLDEREATLMRTRIGELAHLSDDL